METATQNGHRSNGHVAIEVSENPLHRLTEEQIEQLGREFDELHEQVKADLGDRDATYIRSMIAMQRRLALLGRGALIASRWRVPWRWGRERWVWRRSWRTWRSGSRSVPLVLGGIGSESE